MINKVILVSFVGTLYNIVKTLGVDAPEYKSFYNYLFDVLNRTFPNPNPVFGTVQQHKAVDVKASRKLINILNGYGELNLHELNIGLSRGKLDAVKEYKHRTGKSLMDSKRDVERVFEELGLVFAANSPQYDAA